MVRVVVTRYVENSAHMNILFKITFELFYDVSYLNYFVFKYYQEKQQFYISKTCFYTTTHLVYFPKFTELNVIAQVHTACHNFCPLWPI